MSMIVFDEFGNGYDTWYNTKTGAFVDRVETDAAFGLLEPKVGMNILDVGCGTGNFTLKLARLGCCVTGIDISKKMMSHAKTKPYPDKEKVAILEMDAANMDFPDHSFDAAISMTAFEFIRNPDKVYSELKRVVKPGGVIVIGTIQKGGAWERLYSSEACAHTAYAQAVFRSAEDMVALDPECVAAVEQCLFVPPGHGEDIYTLQSEAEGRAGSGSDKGGFVCVKFQMKF